MTFRETPLHLAARNGRDNCCKILLEAGAAVDALDDNGNTPLHLACREYDDVGSEEYYKVVTTLTHAHPDISIKNKDGKSAFEEIKFFNRRRIQQEYEKFSLHQKLMATGSRPVDVVKIFLCGDPAAGKTTIKKTLTKAFSITSVLKNLFGGAEKETDEYEKTPGIDVERKVVKGVGQAVIWDCAGQMEYSVTHGMFLGPAQSIFVVVYNLLEYMAGKSSTTHFWLPFIKATRQERHFNNTEQKPKVIVVATHGDKISDQRIGLLEARKHLTLAREKFSGHLDIEDNLIVLDARQGKSDGMKHLKAALDRRRQEIIGTQTLPKLCDKMLKIMKPWRDEPVPVIGWNEYLERVRKSYVGMDEETLQSVTAYLHIMGDVYWAKFTGKEDQVILNTQWFTTEIIGSAFAGSQFASQFKILQPQAFYSLSELSSFFTKKMETDQLLALLNHMDLVHETGDGRFLIPGKLPQDGEEVSWDVRNACGVKGYSIECAEEIDLFNPSVFPCITKKMLDKHQEATIVSRTAIKCLLGVVDVFVQISKHKQAINVAVVCKEQSAMKAAYDLLQNTVGLIEVELFEKSAGTNLRRCFISHDALCQSENLEDVWSVTEERLIEAERRDGLVRRDAATAEDVANIIFKGYDDTILRNMGPACRCEWLPVDAVERCFGRLDVVHEWREDYRSVSRLLRIEDYEQEQVIKQSESQHESVTCNLIKKWCKKNERKMTIGLLRNLLSRLSLEDNVDAIRVIDDVIDQYPGKGLKADDEGKESHDFGISDSLVRWRRVLKRKRDILLADMDPSSLTSQLLYLPLPMCTIFEGAKTTDIRERVNNAKTLVLFLLQREEEDWPMDLLAGLRETDQSPLAQTLQEEYEMITAEEQHMREEGKRQRGIRRLECEAEIPTMKSNVEYP
ncbi:death-associated protein kinase dapk-1-like [Amphiura filiformis]|uniref:death-associated protein kinase dapk-1-like n=1 Tax=Amphiura filiformis TaxID=82378 RepID=UPI003B21C64C